MQRSNAVRDPTGNNELSSYVNVGRITDCTFVPPLIARAGLSSLLSGTFVVIPSIVMRRVFLLNMLLDQCEFEIFTSVQITIYVMALRLVGT